MPADPLPSVTAGRYCYVLLRYDDCMVAMLGGSRFAAMAAVAVVGQLGSDGSGSAILTAVTVAS